MYDISRRGFVISAAAAAAAFGLDKPLEFSPAAHAVAGAGAAAFKKFKVGNIEVTQLNDGIWERPHDVNFIKGVSVEETKAALRAAGLTDAHVPIPFTVTVLKINGNYVMIDSGTGAQLAPTAGLISKNDLLRAAGIDPSQIKIIAITHFHPDHIFGLITKDTNAQVFPQAEILVPAAEYKFWTDPAIIDKLPAPRQGLAKRVQATFPTWNNIKQFEGNREIAPGVRPVVSYGHTPGHTSFHVSSGNDQLMVLGDVANIPALFVKNPGWQAVFDQDPLMAETTRHKIFDRVVAEKLTVAGYHFGMPGAGTIAKDGSGYVFKPIA